MLEIVAALAVYQAEMVETGDPNLRVSERVEPFDVPGRNYRQFYRNVEEYGPEGLFSYYNMQISYDYSIGQSQGACEVQSANVYLDHVYRLPQWDRYEDARLRDQEVFDEMYGDQRAFLSGYAQLTQSGAQGMLDDLRSLDELVCEEAQDLVPEIADAWMTAIFDAMATYEENAGEVPLRDTVCRQTGSRIRRCRD